MQVFRRWSASVANALNYDFCPGANAYVYWLKQPIGWVVCGIVASLLVGLFIGPQGFVMAGAFLALLVLGVSWPWLCMKGLNCELKFEESRSSEDESTSVILEVTNRFPFPAFGLMVQGQFLQDLNHKDDIVAVALKRLSGWSVSRYQWTLRPKRRGVMPTENPELVTGFPFGLYQIPKPVNVVGNTIVWPKCEDIETSVETVGHQFAIEATANQQAGNDGDTIGARDYRYGDSIRNIHWSHTARHGRLIIRERQSSTQTPIRVVMDLTRAHQTGAGSQSSYENVIRMAASVCSEMHRHQCQIELICLGLDQSFPAKSSNHRGIKPLLDFLAMLPTMEDESAFSSASALAPLGHQRSFTVLLHAGLTPLAKFAINPSNVKPMCVSSISSGGLMEEELAAPSSPSPRSDASRLPSFMGAGHAPT